MHRLSLIIPAFNEGAHIKDVVGSVLNCRSDWLQHPTLSDVEIVVVNDGSTDSTQNQLADFVDQAHVKVVHHPNNLGYGAALKTGFSKATGDVLAFMDGDGTIDPTSIGHMYQALIEKNAHIVIGKRFGQKGSRMPLTRKVGNIFFAKLLSVLSGQKVRDTASGVRVFKREVLDLLYPLPDGLHFTPAMSSKALHEKLTVYEIAIPYADRSGSSKLNVVGDGVRFFNIILQTVLLYNPFKVFFAVGFVFVVLALGLAALPVSRVFVDSPTQFSDFIYRSIGALYLSVCGVQIILFGILARYIVSTFFKRYEGGVWIHKLNEYLKVYERMSLWGVVAILIAVVINAVYFAQYLYSGALDLHWGWLLLAAALAIVGLQMVITGIIMRILRDIRFATMQTPEN